MVFQDFAFGFVCFCWLMLVPFTSTSAQALMRFIHQIRRYFYSALVTAVQQSLATHHGTNISITTLDVAVHSDGPMTLELGGVLASSAT